MRKKFYVFNSFTDQRFCGNPAGVVPDADDLDDNAMQSIARQLNLVETVFVTKPKNIGAACRFHYFMPEKELPIAGHPTIAGWACLAHIGFPGLTQKDDYIQETDAGNIAIKLQGNKVFTSQKEAVVSLIDQFSAEDFMVFNLSPNDVAPNMPIAAIDAGLGHLIFAVKNLETLMKMKFVPDALGALCKRHGVRECQIFCLETNQGGLTAHTRNLCPRFGLEDPACGNGNAALGAYFSRFVSPEKTEMHLMFEQGHIVNMPAIIEVLVGPDGIMIGGNAKLMIEGEIHL